MTFFYACICLLLTLLFLAALPILVPLVIIFAVVQAVIDANRKDPPCST